MSSAAVEQALWSNLLRPVPGGDDAQVDWQIRDHRRGFALLAKGPPGVGVSGNGPLADATVPSI